MNNKISLPELSEAVARTTGYNVKACELFLRDLFAVVAETVAAGENVKIKGIGSFKSTMVEERKSVNVNTGEQMVIPSHRKVSFSPEKALAEAINAPFAIFEPVELNDDVTDQMLLDTDIEPDNNTDESQNALTESEPIADEVITGNTAEVVKDVKENDDVPSTEVNALAEEAPVSQPAQPTQPTQPTQQEPKPDKPEDEPYYYDEEDYVPKKHKASHFGRGVFVGLLCAIALCAAAILAWRFISPGSFNAVKGVLLNENTTQQAAVVTTDTLSKQVASAAVVDTVTPIKPTEEAEKAVVPTETSDKTKVTAQEEVKKAEAPSKPTEPKEYSDKITKHRYLTTMAREYYGDYNLWPLIYDYNKGLGHPDRIRPGTKIKVPSIATLGINPKDPAVIRKAKNRGIAIYKKYR